MMLESINFDEFRGRDLGFKAHWEHDSEHDSEHDCEHDMTASTV
jgi:hypothetical protein